MNKTIIFVALFLILGGGAWWVINNSDDGKSSMVIPDRDFKVANVDDVYRIFIADRQGNTTDLTRKGDSKQWIFDGKYLARENAIDNLMRAIGEIEVQYKPPENAVPTMIKSLSSRGYKVEIYGKEGNKLKCYYIGGATPSEEGNYFLMEGSDQPYVVSIPRWVGNLRPRFTMHGDSWRDRALYMGEVEDIKSVSVEYPKQKNKSFRLTNTGKTTTVEPFYDITPVNTGEAIAGRGEAYLEKFHRIESAGFHNHFEHRDSIEQMIPFCHIEIENMDGTTNSLRFFPITSNDSVIDPKTGIPIGGDNKKVFNYYVVKDGEDFLHAKWNNIEKVLWSYNQFFK